MPGVTFAFQLVPEPVTVTEPRVNETVPVA
jgi:hypothetical protein